MPQTKSAKKALRSGARRRAANDSWRRQMREAIHAVREAIKAGQAKEAQTVADKAQSVLDRAARRNVIPRNKAARLKSKLQKSLAKHS